MWCGTAYGVDLASGVDLLDHALAAGGPYRLTQPSQDAAAHAVLGHVVPCNVSAALPFAAHMVCQVTPAADLLG